MSREATRARVRFERALTEAATGLARRRHHGVYRQPGPPSPTPRERDVIQLLAIGNSQYVAAKLLGIHRGNIQKYMARLYNKAGVHTEAQLMVIAFEEGWVDIPFDD